MSAAVVERLRQLVSDQLGVDVSKMKSEANIIDDLGADSLDVVELVMAIEETFDIEVSDEEAEVLRTVGDVEAFVVGRVAA
jgi:acyl carrier protein